MPLNQIYNTDLGTLYNGNSAEILDDTKLSALKGKTNLIFTSPPFPLARKKSYGNLNGDEYVEWLGNFGPIFRELLAPNGSLVIEMGNSWDQGYPTMSLTPIQSLLELKKKGRFHLCQEFIWENPAKLPSPAQWVNVERIRVKDAFTRFWWLSPTDRPKANNRRVLKEYSSSMKRLLKKKTYNSGTRPSEHNIGEKSFLSNNSGSIPSNVLSIANTGSKDSYLNYCRKNEIALNPSRMPIKIAKFFIKFLTERNDIVLDPFAGSNVTGYVSEKLNRRWVSIEKKLKYAISSKYRFENFREESPDENGGDKIQSEIIA